ncbi:protein of unknown function DUF1555 [Chthoniobacter flavus Ellin428]|uniref:Ice-binding protein C-terminal domain-containing protein n=1 Tax=Chthoniobacter flavus Ellin428 TaxID=497964 RepID=B4D5N2_9BACT|nr:PEP-CTERM sorting domain-containing protein [Chthoniobacter flavus]EDY18437.1 protein of unknown function DUF1555 [Chthoniobacter flavus Ellin428]TCO90854.1 putative secreted protein with PEP-CTERM sorting signal [Chthoniobacter flavus]
MNTKAYLTICALLAYFQGLPFSARASSATTYNIHEQESLQQTGSASFSNGYTPLGGFYVSQFSMVAAIDTGGASLSAAPILGYPNGGSITFSTGPSSAPNWATGNGYHIYHWGAPFATQAALNTQYGTGNFSLTLGNATVTPTLSLNTVNPVYPSSPTLTSGGTWSGTNLLIDPTATTVLTFNTSSFTAYSAATGSSTSAAQIKFEFVDSNLEPISAPSVSQNGLGKSDPALTSFTIAPGTLVPGQTYNFQANYTAYDTVNNASFTGTGISGNPVGLAGELTTTFITIQAVPEPASAVLLLGSGLIFLLKRRRHLAH